MQQIEKVGAELRGPDAVPQTGHDSPRRKRSAPARGRMAKSRPLDPAAVHARESRRLSTLLEVSQALSGTLNLRSALHRVLEVLAKHHGTVRSMVTLLHDNGELHVEASDGLDAVVACDPLPARRGHHRQGRREQQADRRPARQPASRPS